jgi:hypothetical protein
VTDIGRRLIGASAIISSNKHDVVDVDLDGLVRRLLLFDKYVLVSVRLSEFPILARRLGYGQLRDLLSANIIEIRCECLQLAQTAQSGMFGDPVLPLFSYQFHWIDAHDKEKYIHDGLQELHGVEGLKHKDVLRLKSAIVESIRPLPPDIKPQLFPSFENELAHNPNLLRKSIETEIHNRLAVDHVPFSLTLHQESAETFRVETDISVLLKVGEVEAHRIVEAGIMGVAGLSQSIGEMKAYSALSGFRDEELPLFRHKLGFMVDVASSQSREHNLQRIVDIVGLPQVSENEWEISVERLLKVRESSEAREFRDWLGGIGTATDAEITERVAGLRNLAGLKTGGHLGKAMRFLVTTVAGLYPPLGIPLTVFDQFILDKLLPRSGIAAFVNELYPSIFRPASH